MTEQKRLVQSLRSVHCVKFFILLGIGSLVLNMLYLAIESRNATTAHEYDALHSIKRVHQYVMDIVSQGLHFTKENLGILFQNKELAVAVHRQGAEKNEKGNVSKQGLLHETEKGADPVLGKVAVGTTMSVNEEDLIAETNGMCLKYPRKLVGLKWPSITLFDWAALEARWGDVKAGGQWSPPYCKPRHSVAILVPYRQWGEHLHMFINHMHAFLQRQDLQYGIYVIEQAGVALFNRAKLLNVGFMEAVAEYPWKCVVLHDVDNLPANDRNLYACPTMPRHLSASVEKYQFRLPYHTYFGGVSLLKTSHYRRINGMSNAYWGWGAEDDDLYNRCKAVGLVPILRTSMEIGKYRSLNRYHTSAPAGKDK